MCSSADPFTSTQVFSCQAAVAAAEEHLQQLLPKLAATAGVASLSYTTIQNQGSYLVELPATRTNVPQGWDKVGAAPYACMQSSHQATLYSPAVWSHQQYGSPRSISICKAAIWPLQHCPSPVSSRLFTVLI